MSKKLVTLKARFLTALTTCLIVTLVSLPEASIANSDQEKIDTQITTGTKAPFDGWLVAPDIYRDYRAQLEISNTLRSELIDCQVSDQEPKSIPTAVSIALGVLVGGAVVYLVDNQTKSSLAAFVGGAIAGGIFVYSF